MSENRIVVSLSLFVCLLADPVAYAGIQVDPVSEAVLATQDNVSDSDTSQACEIKNAEDSINCFMEARGYATDPTKRRYFAVDSAARTVSATDPNFFGIRDAIASEAILKAKAQIMQGIYADSSAEEFVEVVNPSIKAQLDEASRAKEAAQLALENQLNALRKEASILAEGLDDAVAEEAKGITWGDRGKRLIDALISQLDEAYDSGQITQEKAALVERLKKRRDQVVNTSIELEAAVANLEKEVKAIRGETGQKVTLSSTLGAKQTLFGATVIKQAEYYDDLEEQLQIAVLVAWSPTLEKEAGNILLKGQLAEPRPSKSSLQDWLKKQSLVNMIGPRRFLAADGSDHYLGIAAEEYNKRNLNSRSQAKLKAELRANRHAVLSLKAEAESRKSLDEVMLDKQVFRDDTIKDEAVFFSSLQAKMQQRVEIKGLPVITAATRNEIHPATGKDVVVVVMDISSGAAANTMDLLADTYALLKDVNLDQSYVEGQMAGMREEAESTRNDPAANQQGRRDGAGSVASKSDQAEIGRVEKPVVRAPSPTNSQSRSGVWSGDEDVDDPF